MTARMTREQAHNIVTYLVKAGKLAAVDGQAAVWHDALQGVTYADAQEACRAIAAEPGGWVTPGDLWARVRRIRRARIGNAVAPPPPDGVDGRAALEFTRAYYRALGDGVDPDAADEAACAAVGTTRTPYALTTRDTRALIAAATKEP